MSSKTLKVTIPHKTTLEQVYIKKLDEQKLFMSQQDYKEKSQKINRIVRTTSTVPKTGYYSHINEIRSIKEFLYISEKLKQKNIERKMNERLELKGKLNKIKEIEIMKKMQYYVEKKIRQFAKATQHHEDPERRTFEAFYEQMHDDERVMSFTYDVLKNEFTRVTGMPIVAQDKGHREKHEKKVTEQNQNHEVSESMDMKEDGTSKFLTMKVATKLLGLMLIESSKGKRVPIIGAIDKKQELEQMLNQPFGGKMNFTVNSFDWLIQNALSKSQAFLKQRHLSQQKIANYNGCPNDPQLIQKEIEQNMHSIKKTLASRPLSASSAPSLKHLKNRKTIATEYQISERLKDNIQTQAYRNQVIQEQQKLDSHFVSNDSYASHYI